MAQITTPIFSGLRDIIGTSSAHQALDDTGTSETFSLSNADCNGFRLWVSTEFADTPTDDIVISLYYVSGDNLEETFPLYRNTLDASLGDQDWTEVFDIEASEVKIELKLNGTTDNDSTAAWCALNPKYNVYKNSAI